MKRLYRYFHFHYRKNTNASLFSCKLKLSSCSITANTQCPNLHCYSSHDLKKKREETQSCSPQWIEGSSSPELAVDAACRGLEPPLLTRPVPAGHAAPGLPLWPAVRPPTAPLEEDKGGGGREEGRG
ncbi:hypothetical protein PAHAL_7G145400 [Panicum hallii]|uniref:Uncharacterized protein n=1 Tax=Panicum hallii TaxID=206008 RepID=A0A2S3I6H3_9POAL|nr:hypothetical protein PAHAL_7G145400 [Panicum hallii]